MAEEKKSLTAVEEAELSKAPLYRLGAKLLKNRLPVSLIATFFLWKPKFFLRAVEEGIVG